jgi:hypothetical protein
LQLLQSIERLDKANIIETQNRPIIVHASDFNFYYCKYHSHIGAANRLFKEFLIACFLNCWEFNQSPFCLLEVLQDHILYDLTITRRSFDVPCFGLQTIENSFDLNKVTEDILVKAQRKTSIKQDLLKLAFFDIWVGNEDRHVGNYNVLYKYLDNSYVLYPIDHEACFNHQNFERGLISIDYENSLIYSSLFSKLFYNRDFSKKQRLDNLKQSFYLWASSCKQNLNNYLKDIPLGWNIDIAKKEEELSLYLLNDQWFENCWGTYLEFIQLFINN